MQRRDISAIAIVLLFVVLAFVWGENSISHSFHNCILQQRADQSSNNPNKYRFIIGRAIKPQASCSIRLLDAHNGFVAALAGVFVALFTLALWISTNRLWVAGKEQHAISNRAFVSLDGFDVEITTAADNKSSAALITDAFYKEHPYLKVTRFAAIPRWKNAGSTPTKRMAIEINYESPAKTIPPSYTYKTKSFPFFIGPNSVERSEPIEITGTQVFIDNVMNGLPDPPILIWGRAEYDDVFGGGPHFIEWCYRLRYEAHRGERLGAHFLQWGEYNRSDEDTKA
jgi:hypothetical protein